jgi:hypothetical protein
LHLKGTKAERSLRNTMQFSFASYTAAHDGCFVLAIAHRLYA